MNKCAECRKKEGQKRKDQGSHTGVMIKCDACGMVKGCIPDRHWVEPNNRRAGI